MHDPHTEYRWPTRLEQCILIANQSEEIQQQEQHSGNDFGKSPLPRLHSGDSDRYKHADHAENRQPNTPVKLRGGFRIATTDEIRRRIVLSR